MEFAFWQGTQSRAAHGVAIFLQKLVYFQCSSAGFDNREPDRCQPAFTSFQASWIPLAVILFILFLKVNDSEFNEAEIQCHR
jgi:hypothetical protein